MIIIRITFTFLAHLVGHSLRTNIVANWWLSPQCGNQHMRGTSECLNYLCVGSRIFQIVFEIPKKCWSKVWSTHLNMGHFFQTKPKYLEPLGKATGKVLTVAYLKKTNSKIHLYIVVYIFFQKRVWNTKLSRYWIFVSNWIWNSTRLCDKIMIL